MSWNLEQYNFIKLGDDRENKFSERSQYLGAI